jgi:hypothetical protein
VPTAAACRPLPGLAERPPLAIEEGSAVGLGARRRRPRQPPPPSPTLCSLSRLLHCLHPGSQPLPRAAPPCPLLTPRRYTQLFARLTGNDGSLARFAAGGAAGVTAVLCCFPLDLLRTRLLVPGGSKYGGALQTLRGIVRQEGVGALYTGAVRPQWSVRRQCCVPPPGGGPSWPEPPGINTFHSHKHARTSLPPAVQRQSPSRALASPATPPRQPHSTAPALCPPAQAACPPWWAWSPPTASSSPPTTS